MISNRVRFSHIIVSHSMLFYMLTRKGFLERWSVEKVTLRWGFGRTLISFTANPSRCSDPPTCSLYPASNSRLWINLVVSTWDEAADFSFGSYLILCIFLFIFFPRGYLFTDFLSLKSDCMLVTVPEQTCWSKQSSFHRLTPLKHHISCFKQTLAWGRALLKRGDGKGGGAGGQKKRLFLPRGPPPPPPPP